MLSFELVVVAHNRLLRLPCYGVEWAQQTEKIDSPWYWYCQYSSRHRCDETISLVVTILRQSMIAEKV